MNCGCIIFTFTSLASYFALLSLFSLSKYICYWVRTVVHITAALKQYNEPFIYNKKWFQLRDFSFVAFVVKPSQPQKAWTQMVGIVLLTWKYTSFLYCAVLKSLMMSTSFILSSAQHIFTRLIVLWIFQLYGLFWPST